MLNTYAELLTTIGKWLNRESDPDISVQAAQFVELAEARIRRQQEWFTLTYSLTNGGNPLSITGNPTALPSGIKQLLSIWASTGQWKHVIELLPVTAWRDLTASNRDAVGVPTKAVLLMQADSWLEDPTGTDGPKLYLWPAPGLANDAFAVDFRYVFDVRPLAEDVNNPNRLFLRHPDLYLYAALCESAPFYQHDDRIQLWESRYQQALKEINQERRDADLSGTPKRVRLPRSF